MKCDVNCKYYAMCWNIGESMCDVGEECDRYKPEPPTVAFLCKDKGTEYCHHTTHIEQARNFERVGANTWMEKEPPTATLEPYKDHEYSGGGYLMCTKCKWKFSFGAYRILQDDNYCPHCGASMMKEGDEK